MPIDTLELSSIDLSVLSRPPRANTIREAFQSRNSIHRLRFINLALFVLLTFSSFDRA